MTEHILVPIDESDPSSDAMQFAIEHHPEATITAIHVVDPGEAFAGTSIEGAASRQDVLESQERHAEKLLEDVREKGESEGVTIETDTVVGNVSRSIIEYIEEHDIDHVVIGSHGRTGASRILLGSVAESVTRRSPVPVTVVR
ncbi:universal stress protein [Salinibaculum salinum]|uniref:universal stress protein n=1 Tax=Salinibaculum salinum TaxID=3131996 RepID=UPI0030EB8CDE